MRPTSDRAKETLFDVLADRIRGCRFLDLFSGSGSMGLESASRGAARVVLVEADSAAYRVLSENVLICGISHIIQAVKSDASRYLRGLSAGDEPFDLIFLDPPYNDHSAYDLIGDIGERGLLAEGGLVIAEHDRHHILPEVYGGLIRVRTKRVGDTVFSFYGGESEG